MAFISPFRADREMVRNLFPHGEFIEVYCNASLEVCESRDVKGLYKKARASDIKNYTGIDLPYEVPNKPEVVMYGGDIEIEKSVGLVMSDLMSREMIKLEDD
jgi:adenylylsulfate kinase